MDSPAQASPALDIGVSLPNRAVLFGVPPSVLLETAQRAESSGEFGSVWVGDNLTSKPRLESIVTLAALAGRTSELKLGTVCLASFPLRHPLVLALQWASLDIISGGRTILAVCAGGSEKMGPQYAKELHAMRIESRERIGRLEEGVELMRAFWSGPVTHRGDFYAFDDLEVLPRPDRRIPILVAVNPTSSDPAVVERALRRVARIGDGWQTDGTSPEQFRERWDAIKDYATDYGREALMSYASLHLMVNIDDDSRRARRESVEFLDHYYGVGSINDAVLDNWLAWGPPTAVIEKMQRFIDAGCNSLILRFTSPNQLDQLDRCIAEVLPHVRRTAVR